jgi:hypothetical protein
MNTASSAILTCNAERSRSEYTATEQMPSSRHARITRTAISPRLAINIFLNMILVQGSTVPLAKLTRQHGSRRIFEPGMPIELHKHGEEKQHSMETREKRKGGNRRLGKL